ncbi:hypothetical protein J1N09_11145 [Aureitalea sp. L0-47]|uniref:hypothetical protein n=1 Tax=Aureitalea sp. L0-47 TaxID=2816962 RepID=UPI00223738D6|nr:hypothetical protein [Aureitalea sp. L0-47]MCW5520399.1 hypothetical protein [Aureitalea sp. L0-47]
MKTIHSLPGIMKEISGFESAEGETILWSINDSGNDPKVYGYNPTTNKIDKTIRVVNAKNEDWEDLAIDTEGSIYIGDFGNNSNKRKNLAIYKLSSEAKKGGKYKAEKISFRYEDQKKFPPKRSKRNYDVEAFISFNDSLYLFTKNRSSKFDGTTKVYRLPDTPGEAIAELIGSYKTCSKKSTCMITAASINRSRTKIALLSHDKVWLLSEFEGDDFFGGKIEQISLQHDSQKESISFKNDSTLYIADERVSIYGGNIYELTLK